MVSALRWDMSIVTDSDSDDLPDDWEQFHLRTLAYSGSDDFDLDGSTNLFPWAGLRRRRSPAVGMRPRIRMGIRWW
jgi:hypothetical protein